jgi:hypothetical protein
MKLGRCTQLGACESSLNVPAFLCTIAFCLRFSREEEGSCAFLLSFYDQSEVLYEENKSLF